MLTKARPRLSSSQPTAPASARENAPPQQSLDTTGLRDGAKSQVNPSSAQGARAGSTAMARPAKPSSIMVQLEDSGTLGEVPSGSLSRDRVIVDSTIRAVEFFGQPSHSGVPCSPRQLSRTFWPNPGSGSILMVEFRPRSLEGSPSESLRGLSDPVTVPVTPIP
jgi:hypothetical protein